MSNGVQVCPFRCGQLLAECVRDENGQLVCGAAGQAPPYTRTVLYYAPGLEHLSDLMQAMAQTAGSSLLVTEAGPVLCTPELKLHFVAEHSLSAVLDRLHHGYFNLVVVDLRSLGGCDEVARGHLERASELVEALAAEPDAEVRYGLHRVMALVAACDDEKADWAIAHLARFGVGAVIRDRSHRPGNASADPAHASFGRRVVGEMTAWLAGRKRGKRALCASGGGISGIYFEMGVLKCLDDCLHDGVFGLFDMFYGISAGAVVTALLSNGFTIDEGMAAIAGHRGGRIPPFSLSLVRLSHVNFKDIGERIAGALRYLGHQLLSRHRPPGTLSPETLMLQAGDLFGPPLRGDGFEQVLRELFRQPPASNDFRSLRKPLYIGATDQDARAHVLFGDGAWAGVPISLAVQASFSINPAFTSTRIMGRFFEDGAVTQTSHFEDAIRKGADLIVVIDPLVPYVSKVPGFARRRGFLYNADQNIRTITYTRFEQHRNALLRSHSEVSSYTFLPANRLRRLMSVNPMDHRPFLPIWQGAYLSTLQRVIALKHRMCGDLAAHGMVLDTSRAEEVAARLRRVQQPEFADFFPDRKIALRTSSSPVPSPQVPATVTACAAPQAPAAAHGPALQRSQA